MARERMVTRTVDRTICNVLTCNVITAEVSNVNVTLGGTYEKETDLLKACKKCIETDTLKAVAVTAWTQDSVLYGMTEADFIKYASILPPRNTQAEE